MIAIHIFKRRLTAEQKFMLSALVVNAGNYLYNLGLGRILGPKAFADAAILITMLLVVSFIAMTFQLAVAKFITQCEDDTREDVIKKAHTYALSAGLVLGIVITIFASSLQALFQTETSAMFRVFGLAIPIYFIMSVNRGKLQGEKSFSALAVTYQLEMIWRLVLTFIFLSLFPLSSSLSVAIAIAISFLAGLFPYKRISNSRNISSPLTPTEHRALLGFFLLTACYELTQIICNNSDILLVKHFFPSYDAGLYASLALIGRVVYFVTWMFVMLLLPTVVAMKKEGQNTVSVLFKYVGYITVFTTAIVLATFLFPNLSVKLLFGEAYTSIAYLLGWYALATSFFALSNIFAYYYLSLDQYMPIAIAAVFGILQVLGIYFFHDDLFTVVLTQVVVMGGLLIAQLLYFFWSEQRPRKIHRNSITIDRR